jgi:hypothetical protein
MERIMAMDTNSEESIIQAAQEYWQDTDWQLDVEIY